MSRTVTVILAGLMLALSACDSGPEPSAGEPCPETGYSSEDVSQLLSEQECAFAYNCVTACLDAGLQYPDGELDYTDCGNVCDVSQAMPGGYCDSNDCSNVAAYSGAQCALDDSCGTNDVCY